MSVTLLPKRRRTRVPAQIPPRTPRAAVLHRFVLREKCRKSSGVAYYGRTGFYASSRLAGVGIRATPWSATVAVLPRLAVRKKTPRMPPVQRLPHNAAPPA